MPRLVRVNAQLMTHSLLSWLLLLLLSAASARLLLQFGKKVDFTIALLPNRRRQVVDSEEKR